MNFIKEYAELNYPDKEITDFCIWTIGSWNMMDIFDILEEFIPDIFRQFIDDLQEYIYLPYGHLQYYRIGNLNIWCCRYCGFWCTMFDQRIMEEHLIDLCYKVLP